MSSTCSSCCVTLLNLSILSLLSSSSALVFWQQRNVQHFRYTRAYSRIQPSSRNAVTTISNNEELLPGISAINESNNDLSAKLSKLCEHSFFRLFSVDILASCEYMPQELFECYTETCEIYPEDEDAVRSPKTFLLKFPKCYFNLWNCFFSNLGSGIDTYSRYG
jgi:Endoplasmic Reticulum Oxidoreductin 1 (ERO1)